MTYTTNKEEAERMVTEDILRGNIDGARRWALEYAEHRDNERTDAELDVCIEFWAEYRRNEKSDAERRVSLSGHADLRHVWSPGERVDVD
ncbi:hypothetical protein [Cryobacterium fucosi]|uniref:Uncharacterized protein n=1 Tax=Cryobacterium fucosi TaxID=1259157 RepID=A0A4R9B3K8_9MICO|nr:hypothetical protein [Cryobacterium fucosi]TFD74750.1 hypothetical protein E3T48_12560 [Cryobacterium fucosi]